VHALHRDPAAVDAVERPARRAASADEAPASLRSRPAPVLLTKPDFYGTLAAARLLGRQGIPVVMAAPDRSAAGSWSRHLERHLRCPALSEPGALVDWLLDFGRREPGHVLYPTSDDLAWLLSLHQAELQRHFRMYSPPVEALERLLDKRQLHDLCGHAGIGAPRSWFPRGEDDLLEIACQASYPLLVKRRTQVLSRGATTKGTVVAGPEELRARFAGFVRHFHHAGVVEVRMPEACLPMLQEFHASVVEGTLIVAGFVDRSGRLLAARASRKVLQQPRRLGIALCLEETPLDPDLASRIEHLCRAAGYFGVFQVEFLREGDELLLIDFNPRYYHHLAFEAARGLPLPLLAYLGAIGDEAALADLGRRAREQDRLDGRTFAHRVDLGALVTGQRLLGRMSAAEAAHWRRWYGQHQPRMTDAVRDPDDRLPGIVDFAGRLAQWASHPRAFVRKVLLDAT
jgi:predicted ATP-grasp superfamily ATP-dependent carboligase